MKKLAMVLCVVVLAGAAWGLKQEVIDRDNLSIKAGPTGPREKLSLAWLEAYVFPKTVAGGKEIGVGVRTASAVEAVFANLESIGKTVKLSSTDGKNWGGVFSLPAGVNEGLHAVKFDIQGKTGKIERAVEFFVEGKTALAEKPLDLYFPDGLDLRVICDNYALVEGKAYKLSAGDKLVGLYKVPWYKVIFSGGKEGWVSAAVVQEPFNEYYFRGYKAYQEKDFAGAIENYKKTITINPDYVNGYLWLAKSYFQKGDLTNADASILKALALDERNIDCRLFAANLAQQFFKLAHQDFVEGKYSPAIDRYQKVVKLKPSSVSSWIELGKCYRELGFKDKARESWSAALASEPDNRELLALLEISTQPAAVAAVEAKPQPETVAAAVPEIKAEPEVKTFSTEDSLAMVRTSKTRKGTLVENAIKSVLTLTKSLGTPIKEIGWNVKKIGEKYLVSFSCRQAAGSVDTFEWTVDAASRKVMSNNSNAQTLMDRW